MSIALYTDRDIYITTVVLKWLKLQFESLHRFLSSIQSKDDSFEIIPKNIRGPEYNVHFTIG